MLHGCTKGAGNSALSPTLVPLTSLPRFPAASPHFTFAAEFEWGVTPSQKLLSLSFDYFKPHT